MRIRRATRSVYERMPRSALIAVFCLSALCAVAGAAEGDTGVPAEPFRAPYLPVNDSDVLQDVPSAADPAVRRMQTLRAAFDAMPHELAAAERLADAYIDYSRQIGDAHYAGYAEAVVAPWVTAAAPPAAALVTQATILQYRHQFGDARTFLARAIARDPRNAQAWLTLATLDMVQGDYPAADTDCTKVANDAGVETGVACFGSLRLYTGNAHQGLTLLQQVQTASARGSSAYRAWVEGLIAEGEERLGDWPAAEAHYRNALQSAPEDNFLLVAYADFLLDRGRPREVLALLADHTQSDTAFLRLALAQADLGSAEVRRYTWIMAARFEALRLRGSEYFGREESRFALRLQHDPQTALDLALRNWQVQRAPWDARVVLEAALAAKQPRAAAPVLEFLQKTHLEDPLLALQEKELRSLAVEGNGAAEVAGTAGARP
jgi:Tfp pilus assembly protein PilF